MNRLWTLPGRRFSRGNANPALAKEIASYVGVPARPGLGHLLPQRRDGREDQRECPRARRLHRPAHRAADQPEPDGAADHDRRGPARQRDAHHRGHALLRLRAPGPQGPAARADHGQARRQPARRRRGQPHPDHGTCTRSRFRASSTSRSTTSMPRGDLQVPFLAQARQRDRGRARRRRDEARLGLFDHAAVQPRHRGQAAHQPPPRSNRSICSAT